MKRLVLFAAALSVGCAIGPQDEFKLVRLADGGTEISMPYSSTMAVLEASGFQTDALIPAHARNVCQGDGYTIERKGMRKRPEYADPEKVWIIRCASAPAGSPSTSP